MALKDTRNILKKILFWESCIFGFFMIGQIEGWDTAMIVGGFYLLLWWFFRTFSKWRKRHHASSHHDSMNHTRNKPHPFLYINLILILFFIGSYIYIFNPIESSSIAKEDYIESTPIYQTGSLNDQDISEIAEENKKEIAKKVTTTNSQEIIEEPIVEKKSIPLGLDCGYEDGPCCIEVVSKERNIVWCNDPYTCIYNSNPQIELPYSCAGKSSNDKALAESLNERSNQLKGKENMYYYYKLNKDSPPKNSIPLRLCKTGADCENITLVNNFNGYYKIYCEGICVPR